MSQPTGLQPRAIIESAPMAIVAIDAFGLVTLVNQEAERLFGYSRDELIGRPVEILVPERLREGHRRMRGAFLQMPESRRMGAGRDLYARCKDGREIPVEIGLNPVESDGKLLVLSAIVDISERKRLEERFRATVESAPTAMVMIDAEGAIHLVNAETERLFGYLREELVGHSVEILVPERLRPDHAGYRAAFFARPEARRMGAGRDLFGRHRDGTEFPVEIGLNPLHTSEGTFVLAAIVDITERRRLVERLRERTTALERQTEELAVAKAALERSNLELQQFAYIASHDLQSPLRSISGFVQLLRDRYEGRLDEQADQWIQRAMEGAERMAVLIRDLLSYSRVDSRARPFAPVNMNQAFDDAVTALHASVQDAGAQVTRDELPTIPGDRSQLVQLLQNLIGNAITYHSDEPPRVHVGVERRDDGWTFAVRDNGIGIEAKHHERVFEIFHRLHTRQEYPGTGIGLAICRRVVQRHNGRIWVESEPGQGSTFRFSIPRTEALIDDRARDEAAAGDSAR